MYKFDSIIYLQGEKVCICGLAEVSSPKIIIKIRSANRKSAKCHICERSANLTNYLGPQICGFAVCGNYLRTAHLWKYQISDLQGCGGSTGSSQAYPHPRQSHCSQGTAATTYCTLYSVHSIYVTEGPFMHLTVCCLFLIGCVWGGGE
jgi:hypothetical protein